MIEESILELDKLEEEFTWLVCEEPCRDIAVMLEDLLIVHGYRVFILPNPKGIRTADFIFERKGVYKMFDLKTISGKNSVGNRLRDSIGQTNCVLLHLVCDYNVRNLTLEIKRYFEMSSEVSEVLIFTGRK